MKGEERGGPPSQGSVQNDPGLPALATQSMTRQLTEIPSIEKNIQQTMEWDWLWCSRIKKGILF
jgi:hypothetical protein